MTSSLLTLSDLERSESRSLGFQSLISRKGVELGPMILLTINRKPYMASLITSSLWTLIDLQRSKSKSLRFQSPISHKGAELGHKLLLPINRKPYMASLMTPPPLTLSDSSKSRSLRFQSLISRKGAELDHMLVLTINRKQYMTIPMALSNLTLTDLQGSRSLRFSVVGYPYVIDIFASSNITTIWKSQKGACWQAGFSDVPAVFLVCYVFWVVMLCCSWFGYVVQLMCMLYFIFRMSLDLRLIL